MGEIEVLNTDNFDEKVLKSVGKTVVEFFANWCPDCRAAEPVYKEVAKEFEDGITFYKLDIQENPEKAQEFEVKHIPHFIIFEEGKKIGEGTELLNKKQLLQLINGVRQ